MNYKKGLFSLVCICMVVLLVTTISGCQKQTTDPNINKELSIKEQFKVAGKMRDEKQVNEMLQYGAIGNAPENALVPLVFHKDGSLYTAAEYNTSFSVSDAIEGFYTDLQTFSKLSQIPEATADYAREMPTGDGKNIWLFDPYVKFFQKRSEIEEQVQQKITSGQQARTNSISVPLSAPSTNNPYAATKMIPGNMLYGEWPGAVTPSNYVGHTAGIVEGYLSSANIPYMMQSTYSVEAISPSSGVLKRKLSTNGTDVWAFASMNARSLMWLNSSMSSAQITNICNYQKNQVGKPYSLLGGKYDDTKFYCSKLQWLAYYIYRGVDIDYDGGTYVYPRDILLSSNIAAYNF